MIQKKDYLEMKEEANSYFHVCRNLFKLIKLKDSARGLFKHLGIADANKLTSVPPSILHDLAQSLKELGEPFATFSSSIYLPEFEKWFLDLRSFLFSPSPPSEAFISIISSFLYQIVDSHSSSPIRKRPRELLFQIIQDSPFKLFEKPPREEQIKLFISSSQLLTKLKLTYQSEIPDQDKYRSFVIKKVDEFFEPLDFALLKSIILFLKISVSGYYKGVTKRIKKNKLTRKIRILGHSEELLRHIRNFFAHPEGFLDNWSGIFNDIKSRSKSNVDSIILSPLGKIIFQNNQDPITKYSNIIVKDTLDYHCLTRIVSFVEAWLIEFDKEVSSFKFIS